jgi:hypothetical protein
VEGATSIVRALILDVDGVVSPVGDASSVWNDDVVVGDVYGPVRVSLALCQRLEKLSRAPGLSCWWLTSWTIEMRTSLYPFPGRGWPVVMDPVDVGTHERGWWKLAAVEAWLENHSDVNAFAWCDDHLVGGRPAAIRKRLLPRGVHPLLLTPRTGVGLTPAHIARLEAWASA